MGMSGTKQKMEVCVGASTEGKRKGIELAYGRRRRGEKIMPVVLGATLPDSAKIS